MTNSFITSVQDGQQADLNHKLKSLLTWTLHAIILIFLDMFKLTFQTFLITHLFQHIYCLPKLLHHLDQFITSTLAKYPGFIYRHIFLNKWRRMVLIFLCVVAWIVLWAFSGVMPHLLSKTIGSTDSFLTMPISTTLIWILADNADPRLLLSMTPVTS